MGWYEASVGRAKNKLNKHYTMYSERINQCNFLPQSLQVKVCAYINPPALVHFPVFQPGQRSPTATSFLWSTLFAKEIGSEYKIIYNAVGKNIIHTNNGGVLWHSVASTSKNVSPYSRLHINTTAPQRYTYSASSICIPHPAQVGFPHDLHSSFQHIVIGLFLYSRFDSIGSLLVDLVASPITPPQNEMVDGRHRRTKSTVVSSEEERYHAKDNPSHAFL